MTTTELLAIARATAESGGVIAWVHYEDALEELVNDPSPLIALSEFVQAWDELRSCRFISEPMTELAEADIDEFKRLEKVVLAKRRALDEA